MYRRRDLAPCCSSDPSLGDTLSATSVPVREKWNYGFVRTGADPF